jgi:hypothetical protein
MYESIEEALEDLERILEYIESVNFEEQYHVALEFGHEFKEELVTASD